MTLHLVVAGLLLGALPSLVVNAPAAWMAAAIQQTSAGHVLLADASGTLWSGSAVLTLAAGTPQTSALTLPGRLSWRLGLRAGQPTAWLQQSCCTEAPLVLSWQPGLQRQRFSLAPEPLDLTPDLASRSGTTTAAAPAVVWGQWPLGLLSGLGAPWNTLRLSGSLQLASQQPLQLTHEKGQLSLQGQLDVDVLQLASRLSPLHTLGDYRLQLLAPPDAAATQVVLQTLKGPLQLQGTGHWDQQGLHLRAQASAAPGSEAALDNLLNIIGVRAGAVSNISIR